MKKISILVLMVLVGISLVFVNAGAEEARTIPMEVGCASATTTVIVAHGGTLYRISGFASSANAYFSVHDTTTTVGGSTTNVLAEGGEASQYDSFPTIDFGDEGIAFKDGLTVVTVGAQVTVLYR